MAPTPLHLRDDAGVTFARGFRAAAVPCGIRQYTRDLALIASDTPAHGAGVFTANLFCAPPVMLSKAHLHSETVRAILVNSGNANAATGEPGYQAAVTCAEETAYRLGCPPNEIIVASTGIIGVPLPVAKIVAALDPLVADLSCDGGADAAQAILTTDTFAKQRACEVPLSGGTVRIGGIAKGAGMIMPNMATMLAFLTTDAAIERHTLQRLLQHAVEHSFNRITIDGDTSTNDMAVILANGASGVTLQPGDEACFGAALDEICRALALLIVRDGEGATKFVTVTVEGAPSENAADAIARTIANSPLVKTALTGCNPNWGRILAAAGRAGVPFDPAGVQVFLNTVLTVRDGIAAGVPKDVLDAIMREKDIEIRLLLNVGPARATVWTCDLSHAYVDINIAYS
ncbi:MAG: bifunctional glutamate N-acetyltransferase/amino-acid acetyltransferase ArgJ [bacterium]|nr:bifunctional glutamate N-acetyltransferase/amino-acid acetyltransferase ArgJ [bacterium]